MKVACSGEIHPQEGTSGIFLGLDIELGLMCGDVDETPACYCVGRVSGVARLLWSLLLGVVCAFPSFHLDSM